ncbi:MAG: 3-methylmercaptopropionyl-CoA ligase (DmdB) [Candidatus Carbobacillus altaicus]|uniref:3-methylmercaptopropionyl-CoA ligase (DmdB) n=1 Tax=Candidatus Carbonibacillus altaicus TaxID=2163959 RepID=A0A2R6XXD0_9BACL|nr:MAG: 3-methylmercaptopropionyl-CoA ligase (DmdB) [Candidatus Carbobacillus altaicus]
MGMNGSTMMNEKLVIKKIADHARRLYGAVEIVSRLSDPDAYHRYTVREMIGRAYALAEALQKLGLRQGERVGTMMWNHYGHLEAYFGIPLSGGVLHTINLRLHPDEIVYIVNHAEDRWLIVDDVLLPLIEPIRERLNVEAIVVFPYTGSPVHPSYVSYETLLATSDGNYREVAWDEYAPLGMCYTSGTTGRPKGVVYSHRAILLHSLVSALPGALDVSDRDTVTPVVPMFHVNAWGLPFTATLLGAKQVYPGAHLSPERLLELYEAEQVTVTAGVPTIWLGILQLLDKHPDRYRIPRMRMIVGGAAAPEGLIRGFDRHGHQVIHAWGMTETAPLGTVSQIKQTLITRSEEERYAWRAKQGYAVPLIDVRIRGPEGVLPWDGKSAGELEIRGPWVTERYFKQDETEAISEDGWFKTGDVATIDAEGYVKITDRIKDLIKSGGEWISSVDLENALMSHPGVLEAAVIAVPHEKWGERPLAVVVKKDGAALTEATLEDFLRERFAKWWLPDAYVFVESIPRTASGKFLKTALRETYKNWYG